MHSSVKKKLRQNLDASHSGAEPSRQSLRDEENPLKSVLRCVENGVGATFHLSANTMSLIVVHQGYVPQLVCFHLTDLPSYHKFPVPQPPFWPSLPRPASDSESRKDPVSNYCQRKRGNVLKLGNLLSENFSPYSATLCATSVFSSAY